jgi:WD40 repeat protein
MALALVLLAGAFAAGRGPLAQTQSAEAKEPPRTDRYGDPLSPGVLVRMGTTRLRRGSAVYALPEQDAFLSVERGEDRMSACKWRTSTGELLHRFEFPMDRVSVTVSSDGKTLAASGIDTRSGRSCVLLWDLDSGKEAGELTGIGIAEGMAFAPDGKTITAAGADQTLRLWDCKSGAELRRFEGAKDIWWTLAFSPDGKILASASLRRQAVHLWNTATGRELRGLGDGPGLRSTVVFSPDGKTVATASSGEKNKAVRLWDVATGKEVRQFQSELGSYSLAFSPDGKILAAGGHPEPGKPSTTSPIHLWDVSTGREIHRLPGHVFTVTSLAFSADGKRLVSGSSSSVMKIWDVATGKEAVPLAEHESWVTAVAFSPDGRHLATGSYDGTIRLWNPATGRQVRVLECEIRPRVTDIAFAPDGRTLISNRQDGSLRVCDIETGRERRRFQVGAADHLLRFTNSPDGRTLAVWDRDGIVRLLDAGTGEEKRRLPFDLGDGAYLCFSQDGTKLASLSFSYQSRSGILHLWDASTGAEIRKWTLAQWGPIVFSPDGKTLMGGSGENYLRYGQTERTFHAWDVATGQDRPFTISQHARVESLAISPDGRMLAWGDSAGTITLWELAAGQVRRRLQGHLSRVRSLDFSPDGKTLASGGADTSVLLWDVTGWPASGRSDDRPPEQLWADLTNKDASKAFDAIGLLTAAPEQAVLMLRERLKPAPAPADRKQVARLVADLDSESFEVRQKAMEALKRFGERAEPALAEALKDKLPLEARKRIEELLEAVRVLSTSHDQLRDLRAVEVLEHIGTSDAQTVLQTLADGAPSARLTREARAALQRIARHR